jgi:hypothetical protein
MRRVVLLLVPLALVLAPACSCDGPPVAQLTGKIAFPSGVLDFGKTCVGDTVTATVAVENDGTVPLRITGAKVTGSSTFAVKDFPKILPAAGQTGAKDVIHVTFAPTAAGEVFGDLVVESDDQKDPSVKVKLDGTGDDGPRVDVHLECENAAGTALADCPSTLNYGQVGTGATKDIPVVLVNNGCAELTVSQAQISTDQAGTTAATGFTLGAPKLPFTFSSARPQTVDPTLAPTAADSYVAYLQLTWADKAVNGAPTPLNPPLGLFGAGIAFQATIVPAAYNFAKATTTAPQTQTFTVQNQGGVAAKITSIDVKNGTPEFTIKPASALPLDLPAYGSATFDVTYAPTAQNKVADAVVVTTDLGALPEVPISGGAGPQLEVDPPVTVDFGKVATGATATEPVKVSNTGSAPLNVSAMNLSVNPANTFSLVGAPTFPQTLAPGQSFSFQVQFVDDPHIGKKPDGSGSSETGELDIMSDDPAYGSASGYTLVLQTDTMLNLPPTAVLTASDNGTACTVNPCQVTAGDTVTFDASGSTDPENDPLTYAWTLTPPNGSTATLQQSSGATNQLVPDVPGRFTVQVTVSDPYGNSDSTTLDIGAN